MIRAVLPRRSIRPTTELEETVGCKEHGVETDGPIITFICIVLCRDSHLGHKFNGATRLVRMRLPDVLCDEIVFLLIISKAIYLLSAENEPSSPPGGVYLPCNSTT